MQGRSGASKARTHPAHRDLLALVLLLLALSVAPVDSLTRALMDLPPTVGVSEGASAAAGDWVLFAGGLTAAAAPSNSAVFIYQPVNGTETRYQLTMTYARKSHSAAGARTDLTLNTTIFLVAGDLSTSPASTVIEGFEISLFGVTSRAAPVFSTPRARVGMGAADYDIASAVGGYIVLAGGINTVSNLPLDEVFITYYGLTLTSLPNLTTARAAPAVAAIGDVFVVSGGFDAASLPSAQLDVYYRASGRQWAVVSTTMLENRALHAIGARLTRTSSLSEFVIAGGVRAANQYLSSVESISVAPVVGSVSTVFLGAPLSAARANLVGGCSTVSGSPNAPSSCIFAGGDDGTAAFANVAVVDRSFGVISTGRLPSAVTSAFGAVLPSTGVFIAGGGRSVSGTPSSAVYAFGALRPSQVQTAVMSTGKTFMGVASGDGQIWFGGGCGGGTQVDASVALYNNWSPLSAPLNTQLTALTGFSLGGTVAVFVGGYSGASTLQTIAGSNNVQAYADSAVSPAVNGSYYFESVAFADATSLDAEGVGMVTGGAVNSGQLTDVVGVCDNGFWVKGRLALPRRYHAMGAIDGYFVVAGGEGPGGALNSVEIFQIDIFTSATPGPPSVPTTAPPVCVGSAPIAGAVCSGGVWVIPSGTVLSPPTIVISTGQILTVNGTLILLPTTDTRIAYDPKTGAAIIVSGSVSLNGSLTITLSSTVKDGTLIPVLSGGGAIDGEFTTVTVIGRRCQVLRGEARGLSVLVSVASDTCKHSGLSKGAIAGIVVGAVLLLAVVIVGVLLLLKYRRPMGFLFNESRRNSMTIR